MKKTVIMVMSFLCVFTAVIIAEKPASVTNAAKFKDYFPLTIGSTWKYDTNNGEMKVKIEKDNGRIVSVSEVSAAVSKEFFYEGEKNVVSSRRETSVLFLGDSYGYVPDFIRFNYPLEKGKSWTWKGKKKRGDDLKDASIKISVIGPEKVSVAAGTFDCIKIHIDGEDEEGASEKFYQWYAPGVGMVKSEGVMKGTGVIGMLAGLFGDGHITLNLKEYNIKQQD